MGNDTTVVFTQRRRGRRLWLHTARPGAQSYSFLTSEPTLTEDEEWLLVNLLGPVARD